MDVFNWILVLVMLALGIIVLLLAFIGLLISVNNLYRRCTVCKKNIKPGEGHKIELVFGLIGRLEKDIYVCDECWQANKSLILRDLRQLTETPLPTGIHLVSAQVDGQPWPPKNEKEEANP